MTGNDTLGRAGQHGPAASGISPQLVLGLVVMLMGLMLVLENLGLVDGRRFVRYWPVLPIGIGLARLYQSLRAGTGLSGHFLITGGIGFLLINLGLVRVGLMVAVFMLGGGAAIAWRAARGKRPQPGLVVDTASHLDVFSLMSYISRSVSDPDFRGGQATAVMGASEIDLRGARIQDGQAVINVFAFWGGIEIKVPADWMVEARGTALLGAFEDATRRPEGYGQKLVVAGLVVMGGVEIKN